MAADSETSKNAAKAEKENETEKETWEKIAKTQDGVVVTEEREPE